jgi:hypothetical protein
MIARSSIRERGQLHLIRQGHGRAGSQAAQRRRRGRCPQAPRSQRRTRVRQRASRWQGYRRGSRMSGLQTLRNVTPYSAGLVASAARPRRFPVAASGPGIGRAVRRVAFVAQFAAARAVRNRAGRVAVLLPAVTACKASQTSAGAHACEYPPPRAEGQSIPSNSPAPAACSPSCDRLRRRLGGLDGSL